MRPLPRPASRLGVRLKQILGLALGVVARVWLSTLRLRVVMHPSLGAHESRPWVMSFFHGTQWPLLAWRGRRSTVVLVSWSLDGMMQAVALRTLGLVIERGSSSRGGVQGLVSLARRLRKGDSDAAFAVDGPRGPYGVAKGGARVAARLARGVVVPVGSAFDKGMVLARAWDRFGIAWPFSRVAIYLGPPSETNDADLSVAIGRANEEAARVLSGVSAALEPAASFRVAS